MPARTMRIFAAGSLRHAFTAMIGAFREYRSVEVSTLYGPSGKLRERIEAGDVPDLFAAASIAHVDALVRAGILATGMPLARDSLCVLARPGVDIDASPIIDTLLDRAIRVGTSTPGADPSGD